MASQKDYIKMGLSSSQARLLSLTSRQHDIEYKAQKLEAQKLQMANESNQVYTEYEDALNASKIQLKTIGSDGSSKYIDATYNNLLSAGYKLKSGNNTIVDQADVNYFNTNANGSAARFAALKSGFCEINNGNAVIAGTDQICIFTANDYTTQASTSTGNSYVLMNDITLDSNVTFLGAMNTNNNKITTNYDSGGTVIYVSSVSSFTAGETYHIATTDDLNKLATLVNSGANTTGVNFVLDGNIDMSSINNFAGIGNSSNAFKGTFDGDGHVISNLTINSTNDGVGFFGSAAGATIQNLGLENADVYGDQLHTGILVGNATGVKINNCYTTGSVVGDSSFVGGLVGQLYGTTASITNSYSTADVTCISGDAVGGLVGGNKYGRIANSYATGDVNGNNYVGGLVGYNRDSTITDGSYATGNVTGSSSIGGLIGYSMSSATVSDCAYNTDNSSTGVGSGSSSGVTGLTGSEITTQYAPKTYDPTTAPGYDEYLVIGQAIATNTYITLDINENDSTWLTNVVTSGAVILAKKDSKTGEYVDTNVATDTNLQEVSDEKNLKKAEAKYESSMAQIDAKDKKFDTDIASLDTERNAIKTEIDTLKTVAKDNVDRTFKLFS